MADRVPLPEPIDIAAAAKTASAIRRPVCGTTTYRAPDGTTHGINWKIDLSGTVTTGNDWEAVTEDGMITQFRSVAAPVASEELAVA